MIPPNILILCPDEMKASALSLYGNRAQTTPFIDSWAQNAAVFDQCHTVHPKCTPSRCAFTSAQYPHVGGHRTLDIPLRKHEPNLIRSLKQAGYETALVGKNHTADAETLEQMFDHWLKPNGETDFKARDNGFPEGSYQIGEADIPLENFRDRNATLDAQNWLKQRNNGSDTPFCLWVNWNAPHPPYSIPKPYYARIDRDQVDLPPADDPSAKPPYHVELQKAYDCRPERMNDEQWRELAGTYLDMCKFVDDQVADLFTTLKESGADQNTIVVLWSDHGDFAGEHRLPEKWDTSFYDCITRIPLVISGPGITPGRNAALVESIDILPTILKAVGVDAPNGIQGRDLGPLFRGEVETVRNEVFCQGGQEQEMLKLAVSPDAKPRPARAYYLKQQALFANPQINARAKMLRDERYKYIYHAGGFEEFYDLTTDPHELDNLAFDGSVDPATLQHYRMRMMEKLIEVETVEPHQDYLES